VVQRYKPNVSTRQRAQVPWVPLNPMTTPLTLKHLPNGVGSNGISSRLHCTGGSCKLESHKLPS